MGTKISYAAAYAIGIAVLMGFAQPTLQSQSGPPTLDATLYDVANSLGILRTRDPRDFSATLELWATGTMTVDGQARNVTAYRASTNYLLTGQREDITVETPGGQSERELRIVSGGAAWNEAELGGAATPAPDTVRERLVYLWTTPIGVAKAAALAASSATVTAVDDKTTILTFPLPAPVSDITARATLVRDSSLLNLWHDFAYEGAGVGLYIVKVETQGAIVTETTYEEFNDWNYDDYKEDVILPRRIVQKRPGGVTLELTVTNTNTTNPYVVMPVPDNVPVTENNVYRAMTGEAEPFETGPAAAGTPRTPDGKPDLSGVFVRSRTSNITPDAEGNITVLSQQRPCHPGSECKPAVNFERDPALTRRVLPNYNVPQYRPEFWDEVQYLDVNGNALDPEARCYPPGLPRIGPPDKIAWNKTEIIFMYQHHNTFRVIPIDGRPHDPIRSIDLLHYGDAVGTWEGDVLVIDVVGFTGESWLDFAAYPHSNNMRIEERIRRDGNTITWQVTVYDPEMLLEPWVMPAEARTLNPDPKALLMEDLPCEDRDLEHMMTRERA